MTRPKLDYQQGRKEREPIMQCVCGKEFTAVRSTAKFCSARCRKAAFLSVQKTTPVSVPVSVPCPNCIAKDQEIARLTAQVGALVAAQAQVDHVKCKAADTLLHEGVIAANKGGRITRCDTGRTIGTARV